MRQTDVGILWKNLVKIERKLWDNNEVGRLIKWQRTNVDLRKPVTERKEI